jgi:hypothetical protein
MNISISDYLTTKGIQGNIILYRDICHKKKAMCEFLAQNIETSKKICVYSSGAFGLYVAKAFPKNQVVICCHQVSSEYKQQIDNLPNTEIVYTKGIELSVKEYAEQKGYFYLNQFGENLIKDFYKNHFAEILAEVGTVDTFADCGHSCATLEGAIESGANLQFVLGVNRAKGTRQNVHYLTNLTNRFVQETTHNFDTKQIQSDIETMYPSFGNTFEATRSISAAMSWLQKNPNKTVLVYVGDSPVFGQDVSTSAL